MTLTRYDTDNLRILQFVVLEPGIKTSALVEKMGLTLCTVLRRTKQLVADGFLEQRLIERSQPHLQCAFAFHPKDRLTLGAVKVALAMKLVEKRNTKQAQEYLTLLSAVHDTNGIHDEMQQTVSNFFSHAQQLLQNYLILEQNLSEITEREKP